MCPDLENLHAQFDAIGRDASALMQSLSPRQASWAPSQNRWSVVQCFEHISVSVRLYLERIHIAIENGWQRGMTSPDPYQYRRFEKIIRTIEPPYKFKAKNAPLPAGGGPAAG